QGWARLLVAQHLSRAVPILDRAARDEFSTAYDISPQLAELDALEDFAAGRVPVSDAQLVDVFERWAAGTIELPGSLVARVLVSWKVARPNALVPQRPGWARQLAERYWSGAVQIPDGPARIALSLEYRIYPLSELDELEFYASGRSSIPDEQLIDVL